MQDADLLLHIVDISSDYSEHLKVTLQTLDEIGANCIPILLVFNKTDLIPAMQQMMIRKVWSRSDLYFCMERRSGRIETKGNSLFEQKMSTTHICLDYQHSHHLGSIYQWVRVDHLDYQEDGIYVTVTAPPAHIERLRNQIGETLLYRRTHMNSRIGIVQLSSQENLAENQNYAGVCSKLLIIIGLILLLFQKRFY